MSLKLCIIFIEKQFESNLYYYIYEYLWSKEVLYTEMIRSNRIVYPDVHIVYII